ncbi:hypothetical protein WJX84_004751, partial [Apatococcus fuscideae]
MAVPLAALGQNAAILPAGALPLIPRLEYLSTAVRLGDEVPALVRQGPQPRQSSSLHRNTSDLAARLHRSTSDLAARVLRAQEAPVAVASRISPAGISEALTICTPLDAAERQLAGSQAIQPDTHK